MNCNGYIQNTQKWSMVTNYLQNGQFFKLITKTFIRSSHKRRSIKKLFLKVSQYSQENTFVGVSFLETLTQVLLVNIAKFLTTPISKNNFERLLLINYKQRPSWNFFWYHSSVSCTSWSKFSPWSSLTSPLTLILILEAVICWCSSK